MNARSVFVPGWDDGFIAARRGPYYQIVSHRAGWMSIWRKLEPLTMTNELPEQANLLPLPPIQSGMDVLFQGRPARVVKLSSDEQRARIEYQNPNNPTKTIEWVKIAVLQAVVPVDEPVPADNPPAPEDAPLPASEDEPGVKASFDPDVELAGFRLGDHVIDADGKPQVIIEIDVARNRVLITGHQFYVDPAALILILDDDYNSADRVEGLVNDHIAAEIEAGNPDYTPAPEDAPLPASGEGPGVGLNRLPTVGDVVRTIDGKEGPIHHISTIKSGPRAGEDIYFLEDIVEGYAAGKLTILEDSPIFTKGQAHHPFTGKPMPKPAAKPDVRRDRVQIDGQVYNLPICTQTIPQRIDLDNPRTIADADADLTHLRSLDWSVVSEIILPTGGNTYLRFIRLEKSNPAGRTLPAAETVTAAALPVEEPAEDETPEVEPEVIIEEPAAAKLSPAGQLVALHGAEGARDIMNNEAARAFHDAFTAAVARTDRNYLSLPGARAS